jgi:hypothetical protein
VLPLLVALLALALGASLPLVLLAGVVAAVAIILWRRTR